MLFMYVVGGPKSAPNGTCPLTRQPWSFSPHPEIVNKALSKGASTIWTRTPLGSENAMPCFAMAWVIPRLKATINEVINIRPRFRHHTQCTIPSIIKCAVRAGIDLPSHIGGSNRASSRSIVVGFVSVNSEEVTAKCVSVRRWS